MSTKRERVMKMNKQVVYNHYREYDLPDREYYCVWLDKLLKLLDTAQSAMYKPHVLHLKVKLLDGIQLKLVTDRLTKSITTKSKTKPMFLVKREIDSNQLGEHYHLAIVIEQQYIKSPCFLLDSVMQQCKLNELVKDYWICKPNVGDWITPNVLNSLPVNEYKATAVYWLSYLCKVDTAMQGQKSLWLSGVNNRKVITKRVHQQASSYAITQITN